MEGFVFGVTVPTGRVVSAILGASTSTKLNDSDKGKPVKLIASDAYGLCGDGDEIEGILVGVEPDTHNNGFAFGSVQTGYLGERVVAINKGAATIAVGVYVVAAAQAARNTANTGTLEPVAYVKAGVVNNIGDVGTSVEPTFQSPGTFRWRVVSHLGGTGAVDSEILIERVG